MKGTVQMEELKRQMSDSMPGTMSIFAEAWQQKIGGSLTGAESMNALYDAVEKRQLVSADIMPIVAAIMSKKAEPKLDIITKTFIAERQRLGSAKADWVTLFERSGGGEGYKSLFESMKVALWESRDLAISVGAAFKSAGAFLGKAILMPNSVRRMFNGENSYVADKIDGAFGAGTSQKLVSWFGESLSEANELFSLINNVGKPALKSLFDQAVEGWGLIETKTGAVSGVFNTLTKSVADIPKYILGGIAAFDALTSIGTSDFDAKMEQVTKVLAGTNVGILAQAMTDYNQAKKDVGAMGDTQVALAGSGKNFNLPFDPSASKDLLNSYTHSGGKRIDTGILKHLSGIDIDADMSNAFLYYGLSNMTIKETLLNTLDQDSIDRALEFAKAFSGGGAGGKQSTAFGAGGVLKISEAFKEIEKMQYTTGGGGLTMPNKQNSIKNNPYLVRLLSLSKDPDDVKKKLLTDFFGEEVVKKKYSSGLNQSSNFNRALTDDKDFRNYVETDSLDSLIKQFEELIPSFEVGANARVNSNDVYINIQTQATDPQAVASAVKTQLSSVLGSHNLQDLSYGAGFGVQTYST